MNSSPSSLPDPAHSDTPLLIAQEKESGNETSLLSPHSLLIPLWDDLAVVGGVSLNFVGGANLGVGLICDWP